MQLIKLVTNEVTGNLVLVPEGVAYLPETRFSPTAEGPWESKFNPYLHGHESNPNIEVEGHKYIQFRNNPDAAWSVPTKFIGEDGKVVDVEIYDNQLIKSVDGEEREVIVDLTDFTGEQGQKGDMGKGIAINKALYYDELATYTGNATSMPVCGTCSNPVHVNALNTVLILGDNRHHVLSSADDGTYYKVTQEDTTWTLVDPTKYGLRVRYYGYNNIDPATIIDATTENTLGYKGYVFVYHDEKWVQLGSIAQPNFQVAPNLANNTSGKYLEDYTTFSNTIELSTGGISLEIVDNSITARKIQLGTFGHGLSEGDGTIPIIVNPADFAGVGLTTYTDGGVEKMRVLIEDLISDGLEAEEDTTLDGVIAYKVKVNPSDIVLGTVAGHYTGLETSTERGVTETDNYINIYIKEGDGIYTNERGTSVKADELTIEALNREDIRLWETDNVNKGVQYIHAHKNIADEARALKKDATTGGAAGKFYVIISAEDSPAMLKYSSIDGGLIGNELGVQGKHLNTNVADETKAIQVNLSTSKLETKVDSATIIHNVSGNLEVNEIPSSKIIEGIVNSIAKTGTHETNLLRGDVKVSVTNNSGIVTLTLTNNNSTNTLEFSTDVDETALNAAVAATIVSWGTLQKDAAGGDTTTIDQAIAAALVDFKANQIDPNFVPYDTQIGNMEIRKDTGLLLYSGSVARKLITDENGTIDTTTGI